MKRRALTWRTALTAVVVGLLVTGEVRGHAGGQPLRSSPIQVDGDGFVYVVNPDQDTVTRLSPLSSGSQTVLWEGAVGDYPRTLTLAGDSVYTADQDGDTVTRLARADGARQAQAALPAGCAPFGISANRDEDRLFVSCQGTQEVLVLSPALEVMARIALDWPMPRALAVSGDDLRVYVSHFLTIEPNHDAHVSEIDAQAHTLTQRRSLTIPADRRTCETQNSGQGVTNIVNAIALTPPGSPPEVANQLWVGGTLQNNLTKGLFRRYAGFKGRAEAARFDLPCSRDDLTESCLFEANPRAGLCAGGTDEGKPCLESGACAGGTCVVTPNATPAVKRNVYKASFHDITRFVIWKLDVETGDVVGKIDVDEANHATDITFSEDGRVAYVVDQMFHSFHIFNTRRGQDGNPATLYRPVARYGPFGIDPSRPCDADPLGSVASEGPFLLDPQVQISPIESGDPIRITQAAPTVGTPVATGLDFDTRAYHESGVARMRPVPDAVGTAPIGVALSPDGCIAYVANYLARNVVAVSAQAQAANPACAAYDPVVDFRCTGNLAQSCQTNRDCTGGTGFCNHPGGPACTADAECVTEPCIRDNRCIALVASDPPATTVAPGNDAVSPEILDGKILFNTAARDASVPNGVGLDLAAPLFNDVRRGCGHDPALECRSDLNCSFCADDPGGGTCASDADCGGARCVVGARFCANAPAVDCLTSAECGGAACLSSACNVVRSLPGEIVSTAHDASYVTCTACHVDYGGQDGRTWDFSQFGASLRNTMDLRGRSQAAPGTCGPASADAGRVGGRCHFDAECGSGSGPGACVGNPDFTPQHLRGTPDGDRYFNPMVSVHWNGDRMEVEGFEFTYRSLLGAGDCDGLEHDPDGCLGALVPRSLLASTAMLPRSGPFEGDLRSTLRNVMIHEPTLDKPVNATVRLTHMADFVYSLTRFPRNPRLGEDGGSPSTAAGRGRAIFNDTTVNCAFCHRGPLFTDKVPVEIDLGQPPGAASNNIYLRHDVGTANLFDRRDPKAIADENGTFQNGTRGREIPASRGALVDYVTPVMNDVWNTAPFLHDGSAPTLLDVVRPCDTSVTDCNQPGLGRNLNDGRELSDRHGVTSILTPQQLNDLVEFQRAPHGPVGNRVAVVRAGTLALKRLSLGFGRRAGRGTFTIVGTADPKSLPMDPAAGGLTLTLAVPDGERMALHSVTADPASVRGRGRRLAHRARQPSGTQGPLKITLTRVRDGRWRVVVKGRRADLGALDNGARDVTVALVVGETQFVRNRLLTVTKRGRALTLPKRRRR
jgi:hypothetical protein